MGACGLRELEDAGRGKGPDRQVVVAGPAEPAEVGAAADDLDEQPRAELVSGVKMLVLGGSIRSLAFTAALRTTSGAAESDRGVMAATRPGPSYVTS